jgi:hypothetical protein
MKNTLENLRSLTINTIYPFDVMHPVESHFIGWQEGFEQSYIEVQCCSYIKLSPEEAIDIAEKRMKELDRGQDKESDIIITRSLID